MKRFLLFAGSVIALYAGAVALVVATTSAPPGGGNDGGYAMGIAMFAVMGAMVAAGVIVVGGLLMFLSHRSAVSQSRKRPAP